MPRFIKMWLFSALISFTAIGMWKGMEWYYNKDAEDVAPITVSAEDLAISYDADESFSDRLYEDKYVLVSGVVTNKGDAGAYYTVNLNGYSYIDIDLTFSDSEEIDKLSDIDIGDFISVIGKVEGLNVTYIIITDCTIE